MIFAPEMCLEMNEPFYRKMDIEVSGNNVFFIISTFN